MSSFFQKKQWIKYRVTAKSRHGVHSPFAYHFSENVLYKQSRRNLKQKLLAYFKEYDIVWNDWRLGAEAEQTVIILEGIHQSKKREDEWNQVLSKANVKLSMDVFDFGILLFKKDFLVKQHFVLK